MTQCPIERNVSTLISTNKSIEPMHVLMTHNTNTPSRISTTTSNTFDDSLTNLSWLYDINILKRTIPTINLSLSSSNSTVNNIIGNKHKEQSLVNAFISSFDGAVHSNNIEDTNDATLNHDDIGGDDDGQWKTYKSNPQAKPVYSYSQLILLAMRQSGHEKMTLQMIYEWIADNFPYFKKMEPTWQVYLNDIH